jgi:DNA-directed RNA polymerase specialized sigma54-like protein
LLKELAKTLRNEEKSLKGHKKLLRTELKNNKELIDSLKEIKRTINKHHQKIIEAQNTLLGYPMLDIPSKDVIRREL